MDMVRHNFQFNKFNRKFLTHGSNKLLKSHGYVINKNFSAILRTPYNMIFTRINDIMIRFILHECIIHIEYR